MSLLLQKWINDRVKRFGISAVGALLITFGMYWLMQYMIGVDNKDGKVEKSFKIADFVRIKQTGIEVKHKQRAKHRKPPKPEKQPKSPSKPSAAHMPGPTTHTIPSQINIQIPNVKLPLSMGSCPVLGDVFIPKEAIGKGMKGGLGLPSAADGSGFMDERELTPLVQIPPFYPPEAKMLGREGMIELEYTVTEKGLVKDIIIVDAKNRNLFGQAAMRAVSKWKYRPLIVDGKPAPVRVGVIIQFELTQ